MKMEVPGFLLWIQVRSETFSGRTILSTCYVRKIAVVELEPTLDLFVKPYALHRTWIMVEMGLPGALQQGRLGPNI